MSDRGSTEWKRNNPEKAKLSARKSNIKLKYGISWDEWLDLYNSQEGKCPICSRFCPIHPKSKGQGFAVDHCHTTGRVRSLLCIPCNSAIGQLQEDPEIMKRAITYVEHHKREGKRK